MPEWKSRLRSFLGSSRARPRRAASPRSRCRPRARRRRPTAAAASAAGGFAVATAPADAGRRAAPAEVAAEVPVAGSPVAESRRGCARDASRGPDRRGHDRRRDSPAGAPPDVAAAEVAAAEVAPAQRPRSSRCRQRPLARARSSSRRRSASCARGCARLRKRSPRERATHGAARGGDPRARRPGRAHGARERAPLRRPPGGGDRPRAAPQAQARRRPARARRLRAGQRAARQQPRRRPAALGGARAREQRCARATRSRAPRGDVFTVLLPGIKRDEDVTVIADKLRLALRSPFSIGGHDLLVTASLGIALFPDDGPDTETLLQSATVAMKRAKEKGGDAWDVHAPRSRALAAERQATETQLRRALVQGELELYWQPVVDCETGTIVSVESLLRWRREQGVEQRGRLRLARRRGRAGGAARPVDATRGVRAGTQVAGRGPQGLAVSVNVSAAPARPRRARQAGAARARRDRAAAAVPRARGARERARAQPGARDRAAQPSCGGSGCASRSTTSATGESRLAHLYRYPLDSIKIDGSVVSGRRRQPRPRGRDQRRGRARALAPAEGGRGGRRDARRSA